jgi:hypothetical protein
MEMHWFKNLIEKLSINLKFNKKNSPSVKITDETKIVNKANVATTQVGQVNVKYGLTYTEVTQLIEYIVNQKFIALKDEAEAVFKERRNEFIRFLLAKIVELPETEILKLKEPDTQLALIEAANISGRKQNTELRNLLANLVVGRIRNDKSGKEELKNIVYNEAISTINKLTVDQLKIITLCYLLRYTCYKGIVSWENFNDYLNNLIKPFLGFKNTNAEFQHIEYAGCGSTSIGSVDLFNVIRLNYAILFLNLIPKEKIEALNIPEDIKKEIFFLGSKEDQYFMEFQNEGYLREYLEEKSKDEELNKQICDIYNSSIKKEDEVKEKINKESKIGKTLLDLWHKTSLEHLSLTSVGIAIAATYFEQITSVSVDINIWIN